MKQGISILIPVYNYNVSCLVSDIIAQVSHLRIYWELVVYEDGSDPKYIAENREVLQHSHCIHIVEDKNIGRHHARITLAKSAKYDHLLYLDADSIVVRDEYILRYAEILPINGIVYGGRKYPEICSLSKEYQLHCEYGHQREALSINKRKSKPYLSFQTNNFLVSKTHMLLTSSFEEILLYGHEDTLMGVFWKNNNISIEHIDNPVLHNYLHSRSEFIEKQLESVRSLINISKNHGNLGVRLAVMGDRIRSWGLKSIVLSFLNFMENRFRTSLVKNPENLFALDALKLQYYLKNK